MTAFSENPAPSSFSDLILTRAYPAWAKPAPADNPTRHRKTYTYLRAMGQSRDDVSNAAQSAAYCHAASTCPDDGLPALAATYGLSPAIRDTPATLREYLKKPLTRWYAFGTVGGMLSELAHIGYPSAQIVTWRDMVDAGLAPGNVVFGGNTTFFYVALFQPSVFAAGLRRALWRDTLDKWGQPASGGTGAIWGNGTTQGIPDYVQEAIAVIQRCKPAHTSCRFIVAFHDSVSGLNPNLAPFGSYTVFSMNEPWERIRPSYALNPYYIRDPLTP